LQVLEQDLRNTGLMVTTFSLEVASGALNAGSLNQTIDQLALSGIKVVIAFLKAI
jgi:hypothetical protein